MSEKQNEVKRIAANPLDSFNVLKVLVMLGMPFVHVMECLEGCNQLTEKMASAYDIVTALTIFGPTVFMICMGAGLAGTTGYRRIRKLGIQLIIINAVLNIIRFLPPIIIIQAIRGYGFYDYIQTLLLPDIYSFAGLFMILYSFFVEHHISSVKFFLFSIFLLGISTLSAEFLTVDIPVLSTILGHVIPVSYDSYFPLCAMCIYPCTGLLMREKIFVMDYRKRIKCFAGIAAISLAGLLLSTVLTGASDSSLIAVAADYAQNSEWGGLVSLLFISTALLVVSAFYIIYNLSGENFISRFLLKLSPLLMPFYIFQWIFASLFITYFVPINYLFIGLEIHMNMLFFLGLSVLVEILSLWIAWKKGFTFSRWILKKSDYTRWFK